MNYEIKECICCCHDYIDSDYRYMASTGEITTYYPKEFQMNTDFSKTYILTGRRKNMKRKKANSILYGIAAIIFIILGIFQHEVIWYILGCACVIFSGTYAVKKN